MELRDNDWAVTQGLVDSMQQEEEHILLIVEQIQQVELLEHGVWDAFRVTCIYTRHSATYDSYWVGKGEVFCTL